MKTGSRILMGLMACIFIVIASIVLVPAFTQAGNPVAVLGDTLQCTAGNTVNGNLFVKMDANGCLVQASAASDVIIGVSDPTPAYNADPTWAGANPPGSAVAAGSVATFRTIGKWVKVYNAPSATAILRGSLLKSDANGFAVVATHSTDPNFTTYYSAIAFQAIADCNTPQLVWCALTFPQ
jgi:hypothetical protein